MNRFLAALFLLPAFGFAAEVSTSKFAEELEKATKFCVANYPAGKLSTQEGFEKCLRQSLDIYYTDVVKAVWGNPRTALVPASPTATAAPTAPPISAEQRSREEARLKDQLATLVTSAKCQRCHVGMNAKQFTFPQLHSVLITPSHQEHLKAKDVEMIQKLGAYLK